MEFKHSKHVKLVIDLEIGDRVITDNWGRNLDNKVHIITGIELSKQRSESGVIVKIDGYNGMLDSNWLIKVK